MATLTKLLTTVHTQAPRLRIGVEGMGNCEYCRMAKGRKEKRTPEHEAGCRVDKEVDEEQIKEIKVQARRTARPKHREKRREEDENAGEVDLLIRLLTFEKTGNQIYINTGRSRMKAPDMKVLRRRAEDYTKQQKAGGFLSTGTYADKWTEEVERHLGKGGGQRQEMQMEVEDWRIIVSVFQITKQIGKINNAVEEFITGKEEEGNQVWVTARVHRRDLDVVDKEKGRWTVVVTQNTSINQKTLKRHGFEQFATIKKHKVLIATKIPKGTEIADSRTWARIMDKIEQWKEMKGKRMQVKTKNFQRSAGTISMQKSKLGKNKTK
jgi:hypothetical protein